ncbi:MAG: 16S rRNA (cytosine(967)-C(5))-methyltransferase RsmB [Clostridiales bacterium]|nr:16S rRNA (cytosine(967)-C(5))-methyltransferase RsmB [Clostridiales bacterium]
MKKKAPIKSKDAKNRMSNKTSPRRLALQILKEVNQDGSYANISLKDNLRKHTMDTRDTAFVSRLVYGTLEKQFTIDSILDRLANMKKVNIWIRNILRMGAYQILYMDKVPDSAACNEAVKLCKVHGFSGLQGFVNGTLRNLTRRKEELLTPDNNLPIAEKLSLKYSFPIWLTKKWLKDYGPETTEAIMMPMEEENGVSIRVNTSRISTVSLKEKLQATGVIVQDGFHMEEDLRVSDIGDMEKNEFYREGLFTVQGESSILDTCIVDPQAGEMVLDTCSSPGGKAIHMAELMDGKGKIIAWDIHAHRLDLVKLNAERMKAEIIEPMLMDAAIFHEQWEDKFDRVLIDAPCSGLGTIHKKPDIKLNMTPEALEELPILQGKILDTCSEYVKPGGVLVYSTCTINLEENQNVVMDFLEKHPEFKLDNPVPYVPDSLKSAIKDGMIQLIPSLHQVDGFFISRMRRLS